MQIKEFYDYVSLRKFYLENGLEVSEDIEAEDGAVISYAVFDSESLCAAATLSKRKGIYILDYIAVDSALRRQGIGEKLLKKIKAALKAYKAKTVYITSKNPEFFRRFGFKEGNPENIDMNEDCKGCSEYGNGCVSLPMYLNLE